MEKVLAEEDKTLLRVAFKTEQYLEVNAFL